MGRATIADVAAAAGVSKATVSLVLNGREARIAADTRDRVHAAAAAVGYSPDAIARSLRTRRTRTIGLISDEIGTTPYAGRMLKGAQDAAREHDHLVLHVDTDGDADLERDAVRALLAHRVDRLVYACMWHRVVDRPAGLPDDAVYLDCRPSDARAAAVVPDDLDGGRVATDALLRAGHRRIAWVDVLEPGAPVASQLRHEGYLAAHAAAGVEPDPALHVRVETSAAGGREAIARLFALPARQRPTAVFAFNDRIAAGVYAGARRAGVDIPSELSVVGFDDQQLVANELDPPLTTVALPHEAMGRWAMEVALGVRDAPLDVHRMPCPLVERDSVGPPPTPASDRRRRRTPNTLPQGSADDREVIERGRR